MDEKFKKLIERYKKASEKKSQWESVWKECYEYAFPQRENICCGDNYVQDKTSAHLFDGTAPDAVDQLASSLFSELTPVWVKWFGLRAGYELSESEASQVADVLEKASDILQQNFDHSNFGVEIHQCYLDLVTIGTACLLFEEAPLGEATAFHFYAVPIREVAFEESANGKIDTTFRCSEVSIEDIQTRFPSVEIPPFCIHQAEKNSDYKLKLLEVVEPAVKSEGYRYTAFAYDGVYDKECFLLRDGLFETSPFINFRWLKAPGEIYGRSPVMKALPDIKTANKVVELILKNASIAVTGIWQADDDGILNPANIQLVPGAIIPKAVGSKGLTPLEAPGRFDISQLVLDNLRSKINHSLLADRLEQISAPSMTATEVMERSAEVSRILGATFGRLQSELLTPLLKRAFYILRRRGDVMNFELDGKIVDLQYKSPLALAQSRHSVENVVQWAQMLSRLGNDGMSLINAKEAAKWLANSLSVPQNLLAYDGQEALIEEANDD